VKGGKGRRFAGVLILGVAAVPVVYSLNRGLWIALGLSAGYAAYRLALKGRLAAIVAIVMSLVLGIVIFLASPLSGIV